MSNEEWLALFIETDGTISVTDSGNIVGVSNGCELLIEAFIDRAKALGCRTQVRTNQIASGPHYTAVISGTRDLPGTLDKIVFLDAIEPYLLCKRSKAHELLSKLRKNLHEATLGKPVWCMEENVWYTSRELKELMKYPWISTQLERLTRKKIIEKELRIPEGRYIKRKAAHWKLINENAPEVVYWRKAAKYTGLI